MKYKSKTHEAIDKALERNQGDGLRRHLGASVLGRPCARQIWYMFRWARKVKHKARTLRLFDRGNLEESRVSKWLRQSGTHVETLDLDTGKQFRVEFHEGHGGGSLDSKLFDSPDYPGIWILGEYKTHNDKYFKELKKVGLEKAKPEYYVQAQIYMHYEELPACLHFNVNKNDDDLEIITVEYDPTVAEKYIDRAAKIIYADFPPERISESPGWYICRWCDYNKICHDHEPKEKNCRTCIHSKPIDKGEWLCRQYNYVLSVQDQKRGCLTHQEIPEQ